MIINRIIIETILTLIKGKCNIFLHIKYLKYNQKMHCVWVVIIEKQFPQPNEMPGEANQCQPISHFELWHLYIIDAILMWSDMMNRWHNYSYLSTHDTKETVADINIILKIYPQFKITCKFHELFHVVLEMKNTFTDHH